jgi:hypothetical protein
MDENRGSGMRTSFSSLFVVVLTKEGFEKVENEWLYYMVTQRWIMVGIVILDLNSR